MKYVFLIKQVGQAIAKQRKIAHLTQSQVADKLGIETESVSRMETGAISPTLDRLEQFSELFGCPPIVFFQDDTDSYIAIRAWFKQVLIY
jgi:transcriptional regulator with XRE-family HTH domain